MSKRNSPSLIAHCLLWAAFLFIAHHPAPGSVFAQSATATLSGVALDQNAAAVPEANITVTNQATGLKRESKTNSEGYFTFVLLPPGRYTVRVERSGFSPLQIPEVALNVGDQRAIQIQLKVGKVDETVTVNAESGVQESGTVGTVIDRQFVENLPLNGRSFQSLILLTPGVTATPGATTGGQFSVNGQRTNTNYFTVDGITANIGTSPYAAYYSEQLSGALPGLTAFGGTNNLVSVDALEEFRIQTSTYSAEFGRQPGGQVQLVTRSGSNEFHGSLFEYFRNEALDANDWFNNRAGRKKPPLRQNQFGGTFSGPVIAPRLYHGGDRTFFFFSYEGLRLRLPQSGIANVPSLRLRQVAAPSVQQLLNAFPVPTGPELLDAAGQPLGYAPYSYSLANPTDMGAVSIRIDHKIHNRLTLFSRYNEAPSSSLSRAGNNIARLNGSVLNTRTLTLGATMVLSPRLSNDLRFNYSRSRGKSTAMQDDTGGAVPVPSSVIVSSYTGTGLIGGAASFQFPGLVGVSLDVRESGEADSYNRQINVVDTVSLVTGAHHVKFGVDYRRLMPLYGPRTYFQSVIFRSEADMRNGTASSLGISAQEEARPLFDNFSMYGQDTWKLSRRVTLDLGLRWELNPPPGEANGRKPVLVVGVDNLPTATLAPPDAPLYKTFWTAFAPRAGVAYQLSQGAGRETALRGGFGVYYDLGNAQTVSGFGGFPFSRSVSYSNVLYPISPTLVAPPPIPQVRLPIISNVAAINPDLKLPYTLQWNIALEQALGANQTVTASYVAAIGRRLMTSWSLNQPQFVTSGPRPNPNFGNIIYAANGPTSDYHSLQLQFQRRLSRGLQALVNYTWSHAIDELSNESVGTVLLSVGSALLRGNADFDVRHNLSSAVTYELPTLRAAGLTPLFRNWSVNGIVHAESGFPVDVTAGTLVNADGTSVTFRPDLILGVPLYITDPTVPGGRRFNSAAFRTPPTIPGASMPTRPGTFGRNVLRGLPLYQLDMALRRQFKLTEQWRAELRAEAFNIFNHPNFGSYCPCFPSPTTFGVPLVMLNRSLGGLSSLYQIGGPRSMQLSLKMSF